MDSNILSELVDSTEEGIVIVERSGSIYFSSAKANNFFGKGEDIAHRNFTDLLDGFSRKDFEEGVFKLFELGEEEVSYNAGNDFSGGLLVKMSKLKGSELILVSTSRPKTDMLDSIQLYKLLAENAFDLNLVFRNGEVIFVSPSIQEFLGYSEKDIRSTDDWLDLIYPADVERYKSEIEKDISERTPLTFINYRQKHKQGQFLWFEAKIKHEFKRDGTVLSILTAMDVTKRYRAERELERQKEFIEELFDTDPNLIFVRDGNGKMIYCNKAVADLVGMPRDEFLALEDNTFPVPKNQAHLYTEMENRVINMGQEILIEEKIPDKNGVINHFQTLKKPLRTKDGDINVLNISTNINKLKYYQNESVKTLRARNEFFSAMSHEIRTPMNSIMGMTDLLLKRKPREDQVKLLQALNFSSKNLLNLINDVLDFSKIEAGKIEIEEINFNLKELVDNVQISLNPKAFSKNLSLGLLFNENVPLVVKGDSIKLSQILNNLVGNALKFTEKGNVSVHVSLQEKSDAGYKVKFEVVDTGIGIPDDKLEDIFNPFQQASKSTTRKYGGTGLGLTIVKNLVEMLSGEITVSSNEGEGSVFTVVMPFKKADQQKVEQIASRSKTPKNLKWKLDLDILYVEDVLTNQYLLEEILKEWGVKVEAVSSGKEALERIREKKYDLVLMDIQMPEMDGYEASQRIRAMEGEYYKQLPILALTANTSKSSRGKVIQAGMQDFIIKPVNVDELRNKLIQHSRLGATIDPESFSELDPEGNEVISSINFEQTDKLFNANIVRYQDFLKKTIEEFENNYIEMVYAIRNRDAAIFRRVNHRMKSIVSMLNMNDLMAVIDEIKNKLLENEQVADELSDINTLKYQFDIVKDSLTNKLSSLKWH